MATWWVRVYRGDGPLPRLHKIEARTLVDARNWASDFLVDDDAARTDVVYLYQDPDGPSLGHLYWGKDRLIHWEAARATTAANAARRA